MIQDNDKRAIDDPQLNQDVDFDRKDDEDFDNSDDFHKNDPVDESPADTTSVDEPKRTGSEFDGEIAI